MKLDKKSLAKLEPAIIFLKKYVSFIFIIAMLCIIGFLVLRINQYSNSEPANDTVESKLQTVQRPKLDPAVLQKIEQLQDQNIEVQSLFDQARNNPFSE